MKKKLDETNCSDIENRNNASISKTWASPQVRNSRFKRFKHDSRYRCSSSTKYNTKETENLIYINIRNNSMTREIILD